MNSLEELALSLLERIPTKALTDELARRIAGAAAKPVVQKAKVVPTLVSIPKPVSVKTRNPLRYVVDVIADARSAHGLSVIELAELCDCSPETIYRYQSPSPTFRGGKKRASMARKIIEQIVALTNYGRRAS